MEFFMLGQVGYKIPLTQSAHLIKRAGFKGIFLSLNEGEITDSDISYIRKVGLKIDTLHLPYNTPINITQALWSNNNNVAVAKDILEKSIVFAKNHGISTVILHASSGNNPPPITSIGLDNFKSIIEIAENHEINVAIENIKRVDYLEALLSAFPQSNVGLCFDIGHANAFTNNLYSYEWKKLFDRLLSVHIHDNNAKEDLHLMPGMGQIDYKPIINQIRKYNPNVIISVEAYYKDRENFYRDISPAEFYKKAYESVNKLV